MTDDEDRTLNGILFTVLAVLLGIVLGCVLVNMVLPQ